MDVTVSPATEDEVRSGFVGRQLREFNYKHVGEYPEVQAVRLNARSSEGQVVGGLRAIVAMHSSFRGQSPSASAVRLTQL
jgi:hypothetical protein